MRQGRNKGQPGSARHLFHCVSRVVKRESIFGPVVREQFLGYMREFIEELCKAQRQRLGPKRSNGAQRLRGLTPKLYSVRDLQKNVFSKAPPKRAEILRTHFPEPTHSFEVSGLFVFGLTHRPLDGQSPLDPPERRNVAPLPPPLIPRPETEDPSVNRLIPTRD